MPVSAAGAAPTAGLGRAAGLATKAHASDWDEADGDVPSEKAPNWDCARPIDCQPLFARSQARVAIDGRSWSQGGAFRLPEEMLRSVAPEGDYV